VARSDVTVQKLTTAAPAVVYSAPDAAGIMFPQSDRRVVHVKNASGAAVTVSLPITETVDGVAVPAKTVVVPAGGERHVGAMGVPYRQPSGKVHVDFSAVASVTVAVLEV